MFTISYISFAKSAGSSVESLGARLECSQIMDRIYHENPSYWPNGLNIAGHDGGVYLIRKAASREPIGFCGWQTRDDQGKKVGYYSIGILNEYRRNGYAKAAIAQLIQKRASEVDEVRAFVVPHNNPSSQLASLLGVCIEREG